MENNKQYDELLIKYLANEVNAEEKTFVENWINAGKENRDYFEDFYKAWQLATLKQTLDYVLDEMNVEEKWNDFKQNVTANEEARIIPISEQECFEEERLTRKPVVYRWLVTVAIAASVLLVVGLGWMLFSNNKPDTPVTKNSEIKKDSLTFVMQHEVNTTGKEKRIWLADGSLIVLADKSEITYREPFTNTRDIVLSGKAYFKVMHDQSKPFTVASGDLVTTDLGTEFTVTAHKNARQIIVRLYEGKVVVKAVDKNNKKLKKDIYLLPGQEFVYGDKVYVWTFKLKNATPEQIMNKELSRDNPAIPEDIDAPYFMFNNQSLSQVLDNLAVLYNVKIVYNKKDLQNIYFTAKYKKSESLENILKRIGTLNNLTITKKDTAFIISK